MKRQLWGFPAVIAAFLCSAATNEVFSEMNPLLDVPTAPFGALPFNTVRLEHFLPALAKAMAEENAEYDAIVSNSEPPTFENTIEAMERAGKLSERVINIFYTLSSSATNKELQELESKIAPMIAKHVSGLLINPPLFDRVNALYQERESLDLNHEQRRLLEVTHLKLRRAGAGLDKAGRERLAQLHELQAEVETKFTQNVQDDEDSWAMVIEESDLAGLPESLVSAAAEAARERGHEGKYAITLSRSSVEPFITYSARRDLREKAARAWANRGDNNDAHDNKELLRQIVELRLERARLLGYPSFAHYATEDVMAATPEAVLKLLLDVWEPAKRQFHRDREQISEMARADGIDSLEFWDWRYYQNKVRMAHYSVDEEEVKQYFELDRMIDALFYVAKRLFGVSFTEIDGIPTYHADVRVYEVKDSAGQHLALFYMDPFARTGKRSGAWMSSFFNQASFDGVVRPHVSNNNNISRADPALLSLDDAMTLFHEFGHGLHGILTNVAYPSMSGTNVDRDIVELPSQLFEHWVLQPEVLNKFALHHKTGEPMPKSLVEKIIASQTYGEGFATIEYIGSALADIELHLMDDFESFDATEFEKRIREKYDMPDEVLFRHRLPHFLHLFSGDHYASGYYTYLWAAVLEYDMWEAFEESGNVFDPVLAKRLNDYLYSAGNSRSPTDAYKLLRGRMPTVQPLLRGRGFVE